MIVRYLLAALLAGLLTGVLITPVQYARIVPLILHAEEFESGEATHAHHADWAASGDADAPRYRKISGTGTVDEITSRALAALA